MTFELNLAHRFKRREEMDDAAWHSLLAAAKAVSGQAYCPYSGFAVGAAVRSFDGRVFAGCNVENASYGLAVCAERNAVFHAVAAGARDIVAVALYTPTPVYTTPCGACRQVLMEFAPNAELLCTCDGAERGHFTVSSLLPHGFALAIR
jgi:cytidine deaminase